MPGAHNGHRFAGRAPADGPTDHYSIRITPCHADAILPVEASEIFWGP